MRRLFLIVVAAVAAAALGYFLVSLRHSAASEKLANSTGADLEWLRAEFHLSAAQFAAIAEAHRAYSAVCAGHCTAILAARQQFDELLRANAPEADLQAAQQRVARLEAVCNGATRAHIQAVARLMAPAEGERYLSLVEPHLAQNVHDARRGLDH